MTNIASKNPYLAALEWQFLQGVDEGVSDSPVDRTQSVMPVPANMSSSNTPIAVIQDLGGTSHLVQQAKKLAQNCQNLAELSAAISSFEGIALKKTATNMVFGDGNPKAQIMVIGEAPGNEEDKTGKPFAGDGGRLLDKILASIGLSRWDDDLQKAAYVTNLINWRPPGNRTPSQAELEISLPFVQRHIALISPKYLVLCGGLVAKTLLSNNLSITKLRGGFHDVSVQKTDGEQNDFFIPSIVTYHPDHLLNTPSLKKAVWMDMLMLQDRLKSGA